MAERENIINVFGALVVVIVHVIAKLWEFMHEHDIISNPKLAEKHLLLGLIYLKQYPSLQTVASLVKMEGDRIRPDMKRLLSNRFGLPFKQLNHFFRLLFYGRIERLMIKVMTVLRLLIVYFNKLKFPTK